MERVIEGNYPITFRRNDAMRLGEYIAQHSSVELIGMKRVGISNFLRFFLYHPDIGKTYIHNGMIHYFIPVDLNDLAERDIYPFWTLVLTRLVDVTVASELPEDFKATGRRLFRESIQLKDVFFTVDSIRKIVMELTNRGIYPTFFLIRFDRLKESITPEFFSNLQSLRDAAKGQLSYVFTGFRPLHELAPTVFSKPSLSVFSHDLHITPAQPSDLTMILKTFESHYHTSLPENVIDWLLQLSGGHVQYLQLSLLRLRSEVKLPKTEKELLKILLDNEEIMLQSEELFESLTSEEKEVLLKIAKREKSPEFQKKAPYLFATGMVKHNAIFCPLMEEYLNKRTIDAPKKSEFTKKEHLLFHYLHERIGELCERYDIITAVWHDEAELGISDWAIDRLIARVRAKLKAQKSPYTITTVITRGYKLIQS